MRYSSYLISVVVFALVFADIVGLPESLYGTSYLVFRFPYGTGLELALWCGLLYLAFNSVVITSAPTLVLLRLFAAALAILGAIVILVRLLPLLAYYVSGGEPATEIESSSVFSNETVRICALFCWLALFSWLAMANAKWVLNRV